MKSGDSLSVNSAVTNVPATAIVARKVTYASKIEDVLYTETYLPELLCVNVDKTPYSIANNFISNLSFDKFAAKKDPKGANFQFYEYSGIEHSKVSKSLKLSAAVASDDNLQQPADSNNSAVLGTRISFAERPAIDSLQTLEVQPIDFDANDISSSLLDRFGLQEFVSRDSYVLLESHPDLVFGSHSIAVDRPSAKNVGVPVMRQNSDLGFVNFTMLTIGLVMLVITFKFQFKNAVDVVKSLINRNDATSLFNSRSLNFRRFALLSAFFYILTFSVMFMMAVQKLQYSFKSEGEVLAGYLLVLVGFGILFLAKNSFWIILGNVSRNESLFEEVRFTHQIFFISFTLLLFPIQIIASYASISVYLTLIYISIGLIIILLIQYALRVLRLFLQNGVSFFFWFLYFCTLEMLPILMAFYLINKIGR